MTLSSHPYYPQHLILEHYEPNQRSMLYLLLVVGGILGSISVGSVYMASRLNRPGSFYFGWFIICGLLHCCFESYWLWYHDDLLFRTDLFAELWKEYAHGDSRYLTSDPLVMTLETITVFIWGPLCFLSAWTWWKGSRGHLLYQLLASVGHLFSCSLYFILDMPDFINCDPHPFYFWIYFVAFNTPWIIIPCLLIYRNSRLILLSLDTTKKAQ
ncbi:putative EBP domain protein [Chlamydoabsidia padenii]|nr:putative EBP domain protein [Chlamydoabsidia padenii]